MGICYKGIGANKGTNENEIGEKIKERQTKIRKKDR